MSSLIENATTLARTSPHSSFESGMSARFLRINKVWGMKLYTDKDSANETYEYQTWAASRGLAPKVGERFTVGYDFGYITECAEETYYSRYCRENNLKKNNDDFWDQADNQMEEDTVFIQYIQEMKKIGLCVYDIHSKNFGYMPDGRFVCIDFGGCSECNQSDD